MTWTRTKHSSRDSASPLRPGGGDELLVNFQKSTPRKHMKEPIQNVKNFYCDHLNVGLKGKTRGASCSFTLYNNLLKLLSYPRRRTQHGTFYAEDTSFKHMT